FSFSFPTGKEIRKEAKEKEKRKIKYDYRTSLQSMSARRHISRLRLQSAFGGMYGESGTIPQGMGSLHDLPPGKSRRIYRQIM
ncbi:MAG: hypothetical protein IKK12_06570, partial [Clostridia bacterium]|nr:hypothetical protein [Clostridia bacterium]